MPHTSLEQLIKARIQAEGSISIADYMSLCLSHPEYGYYMTNDPLGAAGDFTTSPEISQIFGEMIGLWLARAWQQMGSPKAALVELGPGRGTLMADLLRATKKIAGFHDAVAIHLVEISPVLRQKQWGALAGKHPQIHWHEAIDELPKKPLLIVANEFFDALPIRQFICMESAQTERMIGLENDRLIFVGDGDIVETCEPAIQILNTLAAHIKTYGGAMLIVDYGYASSARGDTLQAVKNHCYHDVLAEPGTADLTAHVDFAALKQAAETASCKTHGPVSQGEFLGRIGATVRAAKLCETASDDQKTKIVSGLERLISVDQMGDLFKILCVVSPSHPRPEGF